MEATRDCHLAVSDDYVAFHDLLLDCSQLLSAYRRQAFSICVPFSTNVDSASIAETVGPSTDAIAHIVYRCHCVWPPADQSEASGDFQVTAVATIGALHFGDGSSYRGEVHRPHAAAPTRSGCNRTTRCSPSPAADQMNFKINNR
jgi:hypothetical protein